MSCPHCGAPDTGTVTRDGLIAHRDPFRVNYRGRRLDLTQRQAEILYQLVRFGRASFELLQGSAGYEAVRTTVHSLRKRLPPDFAVTAVHGWGFELSTAEMLPVTGTHG
jgi:hypothetical protein